jgi:osmotically-inducible protein OsmY
MVLGKPVPDKNLLRSVTQKLAQKSAGSGTKLTATVSSGVVTLSGVLTQEAQRRMIVNAMVGIGGVRRVIDSMTVAPPKRRV